MKNTLTVLFILAGVIGTIAHSQTDPNPQWISYMNSDNIQAIAEDATGLWLATTAGFVQYNKATGATKVFSKTNSLLPHNNVYCAAVDHQGNKWVGTWAGAAKYDGTNWQVFTTSNSQLPSNCVWSIAVDKNNAVWFATQQGMARLSNGTWSVFNHMTDTALTIDNFQCVAVDAAGNVWAGTSTSFYLQGGLYKYDGSKWTAYTMQNSSIQDYIINTITPGKNNDIWIGTDSKGVIRFDGNTFTMYNQDNSGIADIRVHGVAVDNSGIVWIACESYLKKGGVSKFDGTTFTNFTHEAGSYTSPTASCIYAASDGRIYAGAQYRGLSVYNGSQWSVRKISDCGLPSNFINCILVDSKGRKWFGTAEAGLAVFDGTNWSIYDTTTAIRLPHYAVLSIAEDKDGTIWVGTKNGIVKITGSTSEIFNESSAVPVYVEWVQGIRIDKNNAKWFACNSTLVKYDGAQWTYYGPHNISVMPSFLSNFTNVFIDRNSNIWAGVLGFGAVKFDGTNWTAYSTTNSGLTYADVEEFAEDTSGTIWIGTFGQSPDGNNGGMFTFNGSVWRNLRKNNSQIPGNYINAITRSPSGDIWIGATQYGTTFGGGVAVYDGASKWTVLTPENSKLPYPYIQDIQFDNAGNAWLGTYGYGVAAYNEKGIATSVRTATPSQPEGFVLEQNFPNPFNPSTTIAFAIPEQSRVSLKVFDMMGREVSTLIDEERPAGSHTAVFDASRIASGVYFYRIRTNASSQTRRMVVLK